MFCCSTQFIPTKIHKKTPHKPQNQPPLELNPTQFGVLNPFLILHILLLKILHLNGFCTTTVPIIEVPPHMRDLEKKRPLETPQILLRVFGTTETTPVKKMKSMMHTVSEKCNRCDFLMM